MTYDFEKYDFTRNLVITWPVGVWKTYEAERILARYQEQDPENILATFKITDSAFKEFTAAGTLKMIDKTSNSKVTKALMIDHPLEMMVRCEVMLFDDLWVADSSEAYIRKLNFVWELRDEQRKKGKKRIDIYTTNLWKDGLESKLNERLTSRILHKADLVIMKWKDKRAESTTIYK